MVQVIKGSPPPARPKDGTEDQQKPDNAEEGGKVETVGDSTIAAQLISIVESLKAELSEVRARLSSHEERAARTQMDSEARSRKPWDEEIWVEAMQNVTYPDPGDWYGKFRKAGVDGSKGDVFRIAHREHLINNPAMRELKPGEETPTKPKPVIPESGARGVRVTQPV